MANARFGKIEWFDGLDRWVPVPMGKGKMGGNLTGQRYLGQPTVESAIAHHGVVQGAVKRHGVKVHGRAKSLLVSSRLNDTSFDRANRAYIEGWFSAPDYNVELRVDTSVEVPGVPYSTGGNPIAAAMAVEFGHTGSGRGPQPFQVKGQRYQGKYILHRAIGRAPSRGYR